MKIDKLQSFEYRHKKTLWVSNIKRIPWSRRVPQVSIWFTVWQDYNKQNNIYVNQKMNDDNLILREFLKEIHNEFISEKNDYFKRYARLTYKKIFAKEIIAIHEEEIRERKK